MEGIEELNAYAAEGQGTLVIEFDSTFEPDQAMTMCGRRGSGQSQASSNGRRTHPERNFRVRFPNHYGWYRRIDERTIYQSAERRCTEIEVPVF